MIDEDSSGGSEPPPGVIFQDPDQCLPAAELTDYRLIAARLRKALAKSEALLLQKDELIRRLELLKAESDHRLLNDLQMTISLLSLQSRNSINSEAASQLSAAASRVSMIARIHHRLHSYDGVRTIEFKKFLQDFGLEFSAMSSSDASTGRVSVEGSQIDLPAVTAIPLGFIANELITNAAKYGKGRIAIRLEPDPEHGYALSISNDGPALPEGFDPGESKGLGMKIVRSFTDQIGGELRIERGADGQGARFTVLFPAPVVQPLSPTAATS
ncbi:sensor histidine kinase [Bradyrhizobium sp. LVM 105]|uniref:sensor histidine kinase n=1 Tax=Bradyrhizobium sp. LVM 105 TaxID=2341115 RepID=UPI000F8025B4|nr:sensor histidine kinase [Bradyrhizobium sp. LVM 105]RTE94316.1 sensor histidine kinase [Bradyrhizobium sp. LVM 105]